MKQKANEATRELVNDIFCDIDFKEGENVRVYSMWHGMTNAVYLRKSKVKFLPSHSFSTVRIKDHEHTLPNTRIFK